MEQYKIIEVKTKKDKKIFLSFPKQLYGKDECPQNEGAEKQILSGTHPISQEIDVWPYLVINQQGTVVCRCMLTYYREDPVAYLGFFEAFEDADAVCFMLEQVEAKALADGKTKIIGPIDASIYINYRFKVDRFDKTYTGEPYNKPYYSKLWIDAGYSIAEKYISNQLRQVQKEDIDERLAKIYERYKQRGYYFVSPEAESFEEYLEDVYGLMMDLYSGFSGFKSLTKEQFLQLYKPLEKILNLDMARLVYNGEYDLVAFCICVPNYDNLLNGKLTLSKLKKVLNIKQNPSEYIVLYLGANRGTAGLGGALVHDVRNCLYKNGCTSIGALIREGNVTGKMYEDLYIDKFNYVLLEKDLKGCCQT